MTANEMFERVQDYMDSIDFKYNAEYDEERPIIKSGIGVNCKVKDVNLFYLFGSDGYSAVASINISADEDTMGAVMTYITMANCGLRDGCFEMDLHRGNVRYRSFVSSCCEELSDNLIERSIFLPVNMFERYGNGLVALMMGFSDPVTEINKAENQDDSDDE